MNILAIDVGGTTIKSGVINEKGKILKKLKPIKTFKGKIFENYKQEISTEINFNDIDLIGISIPGFVNHETNVVTLSGNLDLKNFDVKKEFKKVFNKEAFVVNDANAATLGEYWMGAGKKYKSIIFYGIGTGIGGGVVIDGKLIFGANGYAGELGHGGDLQNSHDCTCGLNNCIEATSSASNIERQLRESGINNTIEEIADKFRNGNKKINDVFKKALEPLASHISIMQFALDPEAIIIGGGPSNLGDKFLDIIKKLVKDKCLNFINDVLNIELAKTRNDAGMLGAAYWALEKRGKNGK